MEAMELVSECDSDKSKEAEHFDLGDNVMLEKCKIIKSSQDDISYRLPPLSLILSTELWKIPELEELNESLNETKSRLNDFELGKWHKHTKIMNPAGLIIPCIRDNYNPAFCTQAWGKFWEILHIDDVIPKTIRESHNQNIELKLNSLHLCEAPGAFISALEYYVNNYFQDPPMKLEYYATSLNPYHESNDVRVMINDDTCIRKSFYRWDFLEDNTGDIMNPENIEGLVANNIHRKVQMITADGGIDCQNKPNDQELLVLDLQFAEMISALLLLEKGGSFVLKIFTFFSCRSVCHLYLLASMFKKVMLIKPRTSKEGNSEVYVSCTEYLGLDIAKEKISFIFSNMGSDTFKNCSIFPLHMIPKTFLTKIIEAANYFFGIQKAVISRNILTYNSKNDAFQTIAYYTQIYVLNTWMEKHALYSIHSRSKKRKRTSFLEHMAPKVEKGSFSERIQIQEGSDLVQFNWIVEELFKTRDSIKRKYTSFIVPQDTIQQVVYGKRYENVLGSRFCSCSLLILRSKLRTILRGANLSYPEFQPCSCNKWDKEDNAIRSICFKIPLRDFVERDDFDISIIHLTTLLEELKTLPTGNSIYLCDFTLLSRFHICFISVLANLFFKTTLVWNKEEGSRCGIFMNNFESIESSKNKELFNTLALLVEKMGMKDETDVPLELFCITRLLKITTLEPIFSYNQANTIEATEEYSKLAASFIL